MRVSKMAAAIGLGLLLAVPLAAQLTEDDGLLPVADEQSAEPVAATTNGSDGSDDEPIEPQTTSEATAGSDTATAELESASAATAGASEKMEKLPKTASPLGLLALLGAASFGAGALLRSRRRS